MAYERVDSWYSDDGKILGEEAHLVQLWIANSYSGNPVALCCPCIRSQTN